MRNIYRYGFDAPYRLDPTPLYGMLRSEEPVARVTPPCGFGVKADLATYGKIIGGGMPIGVVAGSARFLDPIDGGAWSDTDDSLPEVDKVWFAGTFNKNPLTMACAQAVVERFSQAGPALHAMRQGGYLA